MTNWYIAQHYLDFPRGCSRNLAANPEHKECTPGSKHITYKPKNITETKIMIGVQKFP